MFLFVHKKEHAISRLWNSVHPRKIVERSDGFSESEGIGRFYVAASGSLQASRSRVRADICAIRLPNANAKLQHVRQNSNP